MSKRNQSTAGGSETTGAPVSARKRQAMATRKRILESALELFEEKGYENVSIDDITSRAGTAKGTFYTYFRAKSDIIIEEFRLIDHYYQEIEPRVRALPTAIERLEAFTKYQLDYIHKRMGYQTLGLLYMNQLTPHNATRILTDPNRPLVVITARIMQEGQERGEITKATDAGTLANWMNRMMRGLFLDWAISRGAINLPQEGMRYFRLCVLPGLAAH